MYNFCCEFGRGYSPSVFHGRVERYPFKDHNTPPLETMVEFANSGKVWMDADPENVISCHCKAGKGRAGLMSCVMMLRSGAFDTAEGTLGPPTCFQTIPYEPNLKIYILMFSI